jgi:hypothetical protein
MTLSHLIQHVEPLNKNFWGVNFGGTVRLSDQGAHMYKAIAPVVTKHNGKRRQWKFDLCDLDK